MKTQSIIFVWLVVLLFPLKGVCSEGQLMLSKEQLFDDGPATDFHPFRDDCSALFYVNAGKNIADMRRDFRSYFCEGMYTLTLEGPAGTVVTLFGSSDYRQDRGFLVLRKKDNRKIWLLHLEEFPAGRWVASEANKDSGGYEAYYQAAPNFRRNVTSVKWGSWWGATENLNKPVE